MNKLKSEQLHNSRRGCFNTPVCPGSSEVNPEYTNCGTYEFCGDSELHYSIPLGTYEIYKKVNEAWCKHGSIEGDSFTGCIDSLKFPEKESYKIEWCIEEGQDDPIFNTTNLTGFKPYFAEFVGVGNPTVKCFNSFTVCIPPCCSVTVRTDAGAFTMRKMDNGYCRGFGTFEGTMNYISVEGSEECIRNVRVAVQLASHGSPPPVINDSPLLPSTPCGSASNGNGNSGSSYNGNISITCFRRTGDSPIETGFMVIETSPSGEISKKLFDENNVIVTSYNIVKCC